jgi:hypothetical protein
MRNQEPRFGCPLYQTELRSRHHLRRLVEGRSHRKQATLPGQNARRVGLLRQAIHIGFFQRTAGYDRGSGAFFEESGARQEPFTQMEETAQNFLERFNGQIGLGSIYNRGNQSAQYNLNADVSYRRERWSASGSYSSNLSSSNGSSVSTRNEIDLSAQRLLRWNNWYYTGLVDFLQAPSKVLCCNRPSAVVLVGT